MRIDAYTLALKRAITPGCTVLDIGTGTGFFALLACRLGARRVYAVEPDEVIQLARIAARDNGCEDRIEFVQDLTTRINLGERVDVIVSDLRTVIPWFQQHIPTIADARQRFLKPGGRLIPQRDEVWAAVVEMPDVYADQVGHQPQDTAGFDMSAARLMGANAWCKTHASPEQLLTQPYCWADLDFEKVVDTRVAADLRWEVTRSGKAHGFVAWFDTTLLENIHYSNAPGNRGSLYGNAFFPWSNPVDVKLGDDISISLNGDLVDGDYIWRWASEVRSGGPEGRILARFSQHNLSTLSAFRSLRTRGAKRVPALSSELEIDRFILGEIDGKRSLRVIAEAVVARFPDAFLSWETALETVAERSARYSG